MSNSSGKTNWVLIAGLAVVLAGVGYVATQGGMSGKDASGSIVAAERYRSETKPISDQSATLGDESIAQFMQTDVYQMMLVNPALADAMASEAFRSAMASEAFRSALASEAFRSALASDVSRLSQ